MFTVTKWTFVNEKYIALDDKILEAEWNDWRFHEPHFKAEEYLYNLVFGLTEYLLHEKVHEKNKIHLRR